MFLSTFLFWPIRWYLHSDWRSAYHACGAWSPVLLLHPIASLLHSFWGATSISPTGRLLSHPLDSTHAEEWNYCHQSLSLHCSLVCWMTFKPASGMTSLSPVGQLASRPVTWHCQSHERIIVAWYTLFFVFWLCSQYESVITTSRYAFNTNWRFGSCFLFLFYQ